MLYAVWVKGDPRAVGVLLSVWCVQAVSRRLLVQCTSFLERQADVRFRRIYNGKHRTRSALLDRIPWPLGLSHRARRARPQGAPGGTDGVVGTKMVVSVLWSVGMVALAPVSQFPALFPQSPLWLQSLTSQTDRATASHVGGRSC